MNVYLVQYELHYRNGRKSFWADDSANVLAKSAEQAIKKAKKEELGRTFDDEPEDGPRVKYRISGFRLHEVKRVTSVDWC